MSLRSQIVRLASKDPDIRLLRRGAKEFSSPKALNDYLREHPKADKTKHTVNEKDEKKTEPAEQPKGLKLKVTPEELDERRVLPPTLEKYGPNAKPEDLKPEHREMIKEYNLSVVGDDAAQAVAIAKEIKKGLDDVSHWEDPETGGPLDFCKLRPSPVEGS